MWHFNRCHTFFVLSAGLCRIRHAAASHRTQGNTADSLFPHRGTEGCLSADLRTKTAPERLHDHHCIRQADQTGRSDANRSETTDQMQTDQRQLIRQEDRTSSRRQQSECLCRRRYLKGCAASAGNSCATGLPCVSGGTERGEGKL